MSDNRNFRILISQETFARIGDAMTDALNGRSFEPVFAAAHPGDAPTDVDAAFISRDVTGLSTKHVVQEPLQAFYETLRQSRRLQWVHAHSDGAAGPLFPDLLARGWRVTVSPGAKAEVLVHTARAGIVSLAGHFPKMVATPGACP